MQLLNKALFQGLVKHPSNGLKRRKFWNPSGSHSRPPVERWSHSTELHPLPATDCPQKAASILWESHWKFLALIRRLLIHEQVGKLCEPSVHHWVRGRQQRG